MSDVSVWHVFAYMNDDEEGCQDEQRRPLEWQLPHVLDWCVSRGFDHIYFSRDPDQKVAFKRGAKVPTRPVFHIVEGVGDRESGDEAA